MFREGKYYEQRGEYRYRPWLGKMEPFKLFGSTYFLGTYQASSHLIDTGDGLILVDTGYTNTFYLVLDGIYRLGFKPEDIKYIINTHWHWDHTEGTAAMADLSGAKTIIGREDAEKAAAYFTADILVDDGDTLTLGDKTITFLHTPGHTKGTISFFYEDTEDGRTCRVGMFGGAGLNTLVPDKYDFEGAREAYFASLERLKQEKVEVFIGNHTWNNDTLGKYLRSKESGKNEFIDETLWGRFMDEYKARLEAME